MINPEGNRKAWREFEQEMQNWALKVCDAAEDDGWDYIGGAPFGELIEWTELRFLDGVNARTAEEEYIAYLDHISADEDYAI